MDILQIPEVFFTDAINAVATERSKNLPPNPVETGTVLRSYVDLGLHYTIKDFSSLLSDSEKDAIIEAVGDDTDTKYITVRIDLEILENLYLQGLVNPEIARPNEAQHRFLESKATETPAPGVFSGAMNQIGDFIKVLVEGLLKGLGIDIPLSTIIIIFVLLVAFISYRRYAK